MGAIEACFFGPLQLDRGVRILSTQATSLADDAGATLFRVLAVQSARWEQLDSARTKTLPCGLAAIFKY
jgi:hypothetical protein